MTNQKMLPRVEDEDDSLRAKLPFQRKRRFSIAPVGSAFPKSQITDQEKNYEKIDLLGVGIHDVKKLPLSLPQQPLAQVSLPTVTPETKGATTEAKIGDAGEDLSRPVLLPCLPSPGLLGERRQNTVSSPVEVPQFIIAGKKETEKMSFQQAEQSSAVNRGKTKQNLAATQVMQRVKDELEPLLNEIKEVEHLLEEELEIGDGDLTKTLFIKKVGIYIEVKRKDYTPGAFCVPIFHCPRCMDHWRNYGRVPPKCHNPRQPTRGPEFLLRGNKQSKGHWGNKRSLGNDNFGNGEPIGRNHLTSKRGYSRSQSDSKYTPRERNTESYNNSTVLRSTPSSRDIASASRAGSSSAFGSSTKKDVSKSHNNVAKRIFRLLSTMNSERDDLVTQSEGLETAYQEQTVDEHLFSVLIRLKENFEEDFLNELKYVSTHKYAAVLGLDPNNSEEMARVGRELRNIMRNIYSEKSGTLDMRLVEESNLPEVLKSKLKKLLEAIRESKHKNDSYMGKVRDEGKPQGGDIESKQQNRKNRPHDRYSSSSKHNESKGRRDSGIGSRPSAGRKGKNKMSGPVSLRQDRKMSRYQDKNSTQRNYGYDGEDIQEFDEEKQAEYKKRGVRSSMDHQKFWGRLSKSSGKGNSSNFLYRDQDEMSSRRSSLASERFGSLGRLSSSFLSYSDSRGSILRRGSRTSRGSVYFSEDDYDPDDPESTRKKRVIVKKEKKEFVRKNRLHHSKLLDQLPMDGKDADVKKTPSSNWQQSLRPFVGEARSRLMSAGSQKRFLPSSDSSELYHDKKWETKGGSQEHHDGNDIEQKRYFEEKMPTRSSKPFDVSNKPRGDSSRTPHSVSSQESLGDIPESEVFRREDIVTPFLELQEIAIQEEDEETFEEPQSERRSRLSNDDIRELQSLQRLPVTNAYTFSFYPLPRQHQEYNEKITRSAKNLGRKRRNYIKRF